ncbi:uncharacterized protein LOC133799300 [Humulus lupulus]|uniref:uncharacterized protein LOC133799300 n=1 Tax=Humulus lupulus TaxID=3486 RepID=UPI002B40206D|nr:uncharacterized protein LOC133799300 [Humulus lupulus]
MKMISYHRIGFVGLLETKVKAANMRALYLYMFSGWCFTSNISHHPNGRIIIAWNLNSFEVDIKGGTSQFIHCWIRPKQWSQFAVTVVYAMNDSNDRKQLWKDIGLIAQGIKIPWIIGGDFNAVLSTVERQNYRGNGAEMVPFQTCVADYGLEDVKYNGSYFTWNNKQEGKARVCAKLDWVLANTDWLENFPTAEVSYLAEGIFDHSPGLLSIYPNSQDKHKPFRYFNYWSSLAEFTDIVRKGWSEEVEGSPMYRLIKKLRMLKQGLRRLHQQGKGDLGIQDSEAYKNLIDLQESLRGQPQNEDLISQEIQARMHYTQIHKHYLLLLRQKAKANWIALGDDNTKLFHASMKQRRMQNTIYSVRNRDGEWVNEYHEVTRAFLEFYDHLLGFKMGARTRVHNSLVKEGLLVSKSQADGLLLDYSPDEVKTALFAIPNDKALGPDGFSSGFFKETWNIIGNDFTADILSFLNIGKIL